MRLQRWPDLLMILFLASQIQDLWLFVTTAMGFPKHLSVFLETNKMTEEGHANQWSPVRSDTFSLTLSNSVMLETFVIPLALVFIVFN